MNFESPIYLKIFRALFALADMLGRTMSTIGQLKRLLTSAKSSSLTHPIATSDPAFCSVISNRASEQRKNNKTYDSYDMLPLCVFVMERTDTHFVRRAVGHRSYRQNNLIDILVKG